MIIYKKIESTIHEFIPNFDYGKRRQDPTEIIESSGYFGEVRTIEERFDVKMKEKILLMLGKVMRPCITAGEWRI